MSEEALGHPLPGTAWQWVAECMPGQCAPGSVVFVRSSQEDRNEWARLHRTKLGHRVLTYQRRAHPREEYPERP